MQSLSDTQSAFRLAIAGGAADALMRQLRVPADATQRLEIYRRHYRESFRRHLRGRYPTVEWLIGTDRLVELADLTLQRSPPRAPSLAEYGAELVDSILDQADVLPLYLADVARIDWCLGWLSVAVSRAPLPLTSLATVDPRKLPHLRLTLQPGLGFLQSDWPVDELVHLRLNGSPPAELAFAPRPTQLQLRGARGEFSLQSLRAGDFAFRTGLAAGATFGEAAALGTAVQPDFALSTAIATLFAEGLVTSHHQETEHA